MASNTLSKDEIVRSLRCIDQLFAKQTPAFVHSGFRISWVRTENTHSYCSVLFLSSKKKLKLAHDRNRRKRLLRELYRLNKHALLKYLQAQGLYIAISINYVGAEPLQIQVHTLAIQKALHKLILEIEKNRPVSVHPTH